MPSTYTTNLGIELPADGEQDGVWGHIVREVLLSIEAGGPDGVELP